MIQELSLTVSPQVAFDECALRGYLLGEYGYADGELWGVRLLRRSIDARGRSVRVHLSVRLYLNEQPTDTRYEETVYAPLGDDAPTAVVVGAGPAGLFAALRLIERGVRPVVVERGKDVHSRRRDIAGISRTHVVDPNSNYGFGEGGAGAFSDGKLFTRSRKRGDGVQVLHVLCQHGAAECILVDAHPHIGTDKLPRVIEGIRNTILGCGGEVHFDCRMTELLCTAEGRVWGIGTADGREFLGPVILATGHSARDVYRYLSGAGVALEAKGLAMGVRLEHPQGLIDRLMYGTEGRGVLPAAEYSMVMQSGGRGVYSFCMCPGGVIVPAATGAEQVVVNGMSSSSRGSRWANSGMVVQVLPEDFGELRITNYEPQVGGRRGSQLRSAPLRLMAVQEEQERMAWVAGGRGQAAPAQRMGDFVDGVLSPSPCCSSYSPGVVSAPLHECLPPFIAERLRDGFRCFGRKYRGFLTNEALCVGVETRTSSPVRILRAADTLASPALSGLYPCGEGAGYAGGIVSAAVDGMRCADALAAAYG